MLQFLLNEVPVRARSDFLNTQTDYGYTALHWCAVFDSPAIAKEVIVQGCDTSVLNYRGKTAWDVAEAAQAQKVLGTIVELAGSGEYPLLWEEHLSSNLSSDLPKHPRSATPWRGKRAVR